ncbi:MAG: hypothetical protein GVY29_11015 [Spirochaetes bacterium]|jgi:hypothetical protein|nr:hypothetical protein [Spirochaetota bacterium]
MGQLYNALTELVPERDPELTEGFERLEEHLGRILDEDQMQAYAAHIRNTGSVPVFGALPPGDREELPPKLQEVASTVLQYNAIATEIRRVAALLRQRDEAELVHERR